MRKFKKKYLLGIDNGGSNIKCSVYDTSGNLISSESIMPKIYRPFPGFIERDASDVWDCNCRAIKTAVKRAGIDCSDIISVSLTGYGSGVILTDLYGNTVYPVVASVDTRSFQQVKAFTSAGLTGKIYNITHQNLWEGQPAAMLAWFCDNDRSTLEKVAYVLTVKDFIRYKLTGIIQSEITDASNNNLIDISTRDYSKQLFEFSNLSDKADLFPAPLVNSFSIVGGITVKASEETGLINGTPVAAGLYDVCSSTIGAGCLKDNSISVMVGTWVAASSFSSSYQFTDSSTIVTVSPEAGKYLLEQSSPTGAANLNWLREKKYPDLSDQEFYQLCSKAILKIDPALSPTVINPYAYLADNLSIHQIDTCKDNYEILYSFQESIILSTIHHLKLLGLDIKRSAITLGGGLSANKDWVQLLSNALNSSITVMDFCEQGTLGAAICAGIAIGVFESLDDSLDKIRRPSHIVSPTHDYSAIFQRKLEIYESIIEKNI